MIWWPWWLWTVRSLSVGGSIIAVLIMGNSVSYRLLSPYIHLYLLLHARPERRKLQSLVVLFSPSMALLRSIAVSRVSREEYEFSGLPLKEVLPARIRKIKLRQWNASLHQAASVLHAGGRLPVGRRSIVWFNSEFSTTCVARAASQSETYTSPNIQPDIQPDAGAFTAELRSIYLDFMNRICFDNSAESCSPDSGPKVAAAVSALCGSYVPATSSELAPAMHRSYPSSIPWMCR